MGRLISFNTGRPPLWREALRQSRHDRLLGTGAGTFVFTHYRFRQDVGVVRHAHSEWLNVLSELGVVGLVLFVAAMRAAGRGLPGQPLQAPARPPAAPAGGAAGRRGGVHRAHLLGLGLGHGGGGYHRVPVHRAGGVLPGHARGRRAVAGGGGRARQRRLPLGAGRRQAQAAGLEPRREPRAPDAAPHPRRGPPRRRVAPARGRLRGAGRCWR